MNIKPGKYKNIKDLYLKNPDYKKAFDEDKGNPNRSEQLESYMDDYGDHKDIVEGVLWDTLDTDKYKFKVSRHAEWRDKTIEIIYLGR